jgi:uncharacterized RDD family membrane protein YckC
MGDKLVTGFDIIGHNRPFQQHWLRRIGAYVADAVLVLFPLWIALELLQMRAIQVLGVASGLLFFLYSSISEGVWGRTPGKELLGLKIYPLTGDMDLGKAMVRNASKFFWFILPAIDAILGLASIGDPRQRLSDRISKTTVVAADVPTSVQKKAHKKWVKVIRKSY